MITLKKAGNPKVENGKVPKFSGLDDQGKKITTKKEGNEANSTQKQAKPLNKAGDTRGDATRLAKFAFESGKSGNPGGKPVGSRNKLQGDFMREMAADFAEHGKTAIIACRTEKPDVYVKVIASLMPRELEIKQPLDDLSEDELIAGVAALQAFLGNQHTDKATQH